MRLLRFNIFQLLLLFLFIYYYSFSFNFINNCFFLLLLNIERMFHMSNQKPITNNNNVSQDVYVEVVKN